MTNPTGETQLALQCTHLRKSFGDVLAVDDVSLTVESGELLALLGPSGCGKTTVLRLIAGFETPDAGSIRIGGRTVVAADTLLPPERRNVGMVFQDYALFPHLTVRGNVRYGLTAGARPADARLHVGDQKRHDGKDTEAHPDTAATADAAASDAENDSFRARLIRLTTGPWRSRPVLGMDRDTAARVDEALALVGLQALAGRYPHELSGGEAQRVALARALAPRPALILLDEPFSNLDSRLRASVRDEVRAILKRAGASAVFVTHDQEEAFSLADRVAVMWQGGIQQIGSPPEIYRRPASRLVAEFVGQADFLPGTIESDGIHTELGVLPPPADPPNTTDVDVMLRPETIAVDAVSTVDAAPPKQPASPISEVVGRHYYGHDQVIAVRLPSGRIVHVRLGSGDAFSPGDRVRLRVEAPPTLFRRE